MKVVILAGGLPSTLIEEDEKIPKPMAEIGGRPILWHIMKQYAYYGYNEFIVCAGYKGEMIKDYFRNFYIYQSDITVDLQTNDIVIHRKKTEDWKVSVIDTGLHSSVTERILMAKEYIGKEAFLVTYGDCVSNINISRLVEQHLRNGEIATFAVARPTGRNEILPLDDKGKIDLALGEENIADAWVNAGSIVFEPEIFRYLQSKDVLMGRGMLAKLAKDQQVTAYHHNGFWSPMETIRDKTILETLWSQKKAPWKVWED